MADAENIAATMGLRPDWPNLGVISPAHSYGFSNLVLPLLLHGIPLILAPAPLPEIIRQAAENQPAITLPAVPAMWRAWHAAGAIRQNVRLAISAGAPLPVHLEQEMFRAHGIKIHNFLGSSECGGIAYDATPEPMAGEEGFVGTAMHGVTITHADCEEPGPIEVRSAAVGDGYFPEEDCAVLDGVRFIPGDLVQATPRGLVLVGRASEVINIAGRKLNPLELEHRLRACPGVVQAVVFGVPSRVRGEDVIACVVAPATDPVAIQRFCQRELSPWQMPRDIWIVPAIPANERGKISRRVLADEYLKSRTP
jgi:acyl-coenzyme A synthetase/AMP-(fatty) acid ligase